MASDDLCGKVEANIEIKASQSQFHDMVKHKPHHMSNVSSDKIQGVHLHEGEWGTVGAVLLWNYFHDGQARVAKEIIEAIDDEKNLITFRVIEGDLMDHFKSFLFTVQANPKPDGGEGCVVHCTIEYEKHHHEIIEPHSLVEFAIEVCKDIEVHLLTENTVITSNNLCCKIETDIEIKASPTQFHHIFRHKPHHLSNVSSSKVHGAELLEGEWGSVGSVTYWQYFHDGKARVAKIIVESVDDEKNSITYRVVEGDLMEHFKSFLVTLQCNPKPDGGEGSVIHWTMEYEKHHDEIIDPHTLLELAIDVSKDLEVHLLEEDN